VMTLGDHKEIVQIAETRWLCERQTRPSRMA
jgi:hypothetical protein